MNSPKEDLVGNSEGILTKDQVLLAQKPQQVLKQAVVPARVPSRHAWYVPRQRVMDIVCENLIRSHRDPQVVGLVGESGSGKTTSAAEIVRSPQILEFFSDGVVWLPVHESAAHCLPSLMLQLARMIRDDIVGEVSDEAVGATCHCAEDLGQGGTSYVKDVMTGRFHEGRGPLRCLVVADNVWEEEVVACLRDTGVWVLVTTRREEVVKAAGGESVRINRMFGADAEMLLKRASGLPTGVGWQEGAREVVELCGRVAMDVAYVGKWSTIGKENDTAAWSSAAAAIRAELQDTSRVLGITGEYASKDELHLTRRSSSETGSLSVDSESDSTKEDARTTTRRAVLRAGFRALSTITHVDSRVQELFLALGVMPDGHEFSLTDTAVLLGIHLGKGALDELEEVRMVLQTLERWTIVTARGKAFRVHDAHLSFAREILAVCSDIQYEVVDRWVRFISSLDTILSVEPQSLARMWSAVERIGGEGWRVTRPYERALAQLHVDDPYYRAGVEAVAKFRMLDGDWGGAYVMWQTLLVIEQTAGTLDVRHLLREIVEAAENKGTGTEAMFGLKGSVQTESMLRQALEAEMALPKPDEMLVRRVTFHLGLCLRQERRLRAAEGCLRKALDMEKATQAPNELHIARSLYELGLCLRLMGRLTEAEELLLCSLSIWETRLGPVDPTVGHTLDEIGTCARQSGRQEDAEAYLRRALSIKQAFVAQSEGNMGQDSVARTMFQLGLCVMLSGRQQEAEDLLRNVLVLEEERVAGRDEIAVGRIVFHLGICLRKGGRREESELMFRRALTMLEASLGRDNKEVAAVEEMINSTHATE